MGGSHHWQSWSGLSQARPARVLRPADAGEVADAVVAARRNGLRVKMVGSGHSFTDIAVTDGLLLRPDRLTGIRAVDRAAMTVTVEAGTTLRDLNARLEALGLALHNLGDIDAQTVAGAISTGTHGAGGRWASLSAQVVAVELVLADGTLLVASEHEDPDLFEAARLGLGAVGVLTAVTFAVEPAFLLQATEWPIAWSEIVDVLDDLAAEHHHVDLHWFPHTERALAKVNDRTLDGAAPLSRARAWFEDDLMANGAFGAINRVGNSSPRLVPALNRLAARGLSTREYVDVSHRVLVSERRVRFKEMEYAVPREAALAALAEARRVMERGGWPVSFPVEIRPTPADDLWLSTSSGHASVYLAFHVNAATDHTGYFGAVERVLLDHGGRPHWGKVHTCSAEALATAYPSWGRFQAVRDRVDPERVFGNPYLEKVLGP
ncbi:D-arabinono-1,4-lactone oxidase [Nocardioides mesophilus]|uniref:FAD-binding protein n=1 Tax=Nocardioides mesophilus TaxID=433659 RepID=A0A7G9RBL3_9ACTN|nr:D-arabinono-1,4-lactone oxidase [Nocardioides mesophilus]QNN52988.1 FAD-binding protein [Nocardioides mesophilus]